MSTETTDTIHEGVKKDITLNLSIDTSGQTIELYAFDKRMPNDEGTLLGSVDGESEGTDIVFLSTDTHLLKARHTYILEAWINPDDAGRKCVHPEDPDMHYLKIMDRRKVDV